MLAMLNENDTYMYKGFLDMLEKAPPNGRYIHDIANKITALRGAIQFKIKLGEESEADIKKLIREIYSCTNYDSGV